MATRKKVESIKSFEEAEAILIERNAGWTETKIANNTWMYRASENSIAIRLHSTRIVQYLRNGCVIVNSGGWKSVTTKERINRYSPFRVSQKNYQWFISLKGDSTLFQDNMFGYV